LGSCQRLTHLVRAFRFGPLEPGRARYYGRGRRDVTGHQVVLLDGVYHVLKICEPAHGYSDTEGLAAELDHHPRVPVTRPHGELLLGLFFLVFYHRLEDRRLFWYSIWGTRRTFCNGIESSLSHRFCCAVGDDYLCDVLICCAGERRNRLVLRVCSAEIPIEDCVRS